MQSACSAGYSTSFAAAPRSRPALFATTLSRAMTTQFGEHDVHAWYVTKTKHNG